MTLPEGKVFCNNMVVKRSRILPTCIEICEHTKSGSLLIATCSKVGIKVRIKTYNPPTNYGSPWISFVEQDILVRRKIWITILILEYIHPDGRRLGSIGPSIIDLVNDQLDLMRSNGQIANIR